MKKYEIEIIFKDNKKEIIYGYKSSQSGADIIRRIFTEIREDKRRIMFAVKNDVYVYHIDDIKHLKILEVD